MTASAASPLSVGSPTGLQSFVRKPVGIQPPGEGAFKKVERVALVAMKNLTGSISSPESGSEEPLSERLSTDQFLRLSSDSQAVCATMKLENSATFREINRECEVIRDLQTAGVQGVPRVITTPERDVDGTTKMLVQYAGIPANTWSQGKSWHSVLTCMGKVSDTLGQVHTAGYVHRDMKPLNICIHPVTNQPTIIDFGGAKRIREASRTDEERTQDIDETNGTTAAYRAPAQNYTYEGSEDLYAFGASLCEMLSGQVGGSFGNNLWQAIFPETEFNQMGYMYNLAMFGARFTPEKIRKVVSNMLTVGGIQPGPLKEAVTETLMLALEPGHSIEEFQTSLRNLILTHGEELQQMKTPESSSALDSSRSSIASRQNIDTGGTVRMINMTSLTL